MGLDINMSVECNNKFPSHSPNFPLDLDIHPSVPHQDGNASDLDVNFGPLAQELAIRQYGIAGRVWEASYAMTVYLHPPSHLEFDPPIFDLSKLSNGYIILELGSGSGLVASTLAKYLDPERDHLIATDLPEVCPLLNGNLALAPTGQALITVMPLSWGKYEDVLAVASKFFRDGDRVLTHIVCSDLVYFPELLAPLLRSLLHLSSPPFIPADGTIEESLTLYISYKIRSLSKETSFWLAFGLWFEFRPVLMKDKSKTADWEVYGSDFDDATFLFVAHRRPESYAWKIPLLDEELLGGVGALGTDSRKGDDTFESLLFMSLL